jgi:CRP/FNR family transcriptional regulator
MRTPFSDFSFNNDPEFLDEIEKTGVYYSYQPNDIIIKNEKYVRAIPLIIKGTVKVSRVNREGNEIFLYYLEEGQTCATAVSAHLMNKPCRINAVAEDETELIAIPVANCYKWLTQYPGWRDFIMKALSEKCDVLLNTVDQFAFTNTDERLMAFLSSKSKVLNTNIIHMTHQEIANELSTSREVVSRLLKRLEQARELKLYRNKIELNFVV